MGRASEEFPMLGMGLLTLQQVISRCWVCRLGTDCRERCKETFYISETARLDGRRQGQLGREGYSTDVLIPNWGSA